MVCVSLPAHPLAYPCVKERKGDGGEGFYWPFHLTCKNKKFVVSLSPIFLLFLGTFSLRQKVYYLSNKGSVTIQNRYSTYSLCCFWQLWTNSYIRQSAVCILETLSLSWYISDHLGKELQYQQFLNFFFSGQPLTVLSVLICAFSRKGCSWCISGTSRSTNLIFQSVLPCLPYYKTEVSKLDTPAHWEWLPQHKPSLPFSRKVSVMCHWSPITCALAGRICLEIEA